jgi:hypothetical protein
LAKQTLIGLTLLLCLGAGLLLVMGSFQVALADEPGPRPTRTPTHTPLPSDTPIITITYTPPVTITSVPYFKLYLPKVSRPQEGAEGKPVPTATQPTDSGATGPEPIFWAYLFILFAAAAVVVIIITVYLWRQKKQNNP